MDVHGVVWLIAILAAVWIGATVTAANDCEALDSEIGAYNIQHDPAYSPSVTPLQFAH